MGAISVALQALRAGIQSSSLPAEAIRGITENIDRLLPAADTMEDVVHSPNFPDVARAYTSGVIGETISVAALGPFMPFLLGELAGLAAITPVLPAVIGAAIIFGVGWGIGEGVDWALKGVGDDLDGMLRHILADPVVLDLNGNGISLTSLAGSATHFDLDNDGHDERTGWVSPTDGFLVHDLNHNGTLDGVGELVGSANVDGYDALAALDGNADGRIDASDAAFADLLVWRDLNSDGIATEDEIQTLGDAGIAALNLAYDQVDEDAAGNTIARLGSYTVTTGQDNDLWRAAA